MGSRAANRIPISYSRFPTPQYLDPRLVTQQPEQAEIAVQFAVEHRFQVELDVSDAGQADIVAQDAEAQPVANKAPQMVVTAVETFLQQAVGAAFDGLAVVSAVQLLPEGE